MTLISFWNSPSLLSDGPFAIYRIRTVFATSSQTSCHLLFDIVCHEIMPIFSLIFFEICPQSLQQMTEHARFPLYDYHKPQDATGLPPKLHCIKKFLLDVTDRSRGTVLLMAYVSGDFISFSKNLMSLQALNFMAS